MPCKYGLGIALHTKGIVSIKALRQRGIIERAMAGDRDISVCFRDTHCVPSILLSHPPLHPQP